jgi:Spy/CpxP family protein refolding chaperone
LFSIRSFGIAAFAALLALPVAALAQQAPATPPTAPMQPGAETPGHHRHGGHHNGFRAALAKLDLSPQQKTQIQQALTQSREANRNADPATRKANRDKLHAQIEAILTPAQRTQLQAGLAQERARHHREGGAWSSPGPSATPAH